ncbi:MAG: acyl carrier protein [Gammaproteobacteria bacterium]|nr:acyl carrier protein [Gammaproteobacteria bacterium]
MSTLDMPSLELEIKQLIIATLDLEDLSPDDIANDTVLFGSGEGLGLDSIDALELGVALQKKYQIKLDAHDAEAKEHFQTVDRLAAFIRANPPA